MDNTKLNKNKKINKNSYAVLFIHTKISRNITDANFINRAV